MKREITQGLETPEREIKVAKIEDFNPIDTYRFLPGWDYKYFSLGEEEVFAEGWTFSKSIGDKEWNLRIISKTKGKSPKKEVALYRQPWLDVGLHLDDVEKVEFNYQTGHLTFFGGKARYEISEDGSSHDLVSSDGKVYASAKIVETN